MSLFSVTQTKQIKEKVADDLHEMEKPLARYRDDKDLDNMLKAQEREDDPMLAYMKQRKIKQNIKEGKKGKNDPMLAYMKQRNVKQNIKEGKKGKSSYSFKPIQYTGCRLPGWILW